MDLGHREPLKGFKGASKAGNGPGTKPEQEEGLPQIASGQPLPYKYGGPSLSPSAVLFLTS